MGDTYLLPRRLLEEMLAHCRREAPLEACGLLGGPNPGEAARIIPLQNAAASEQFYRLEASEVLAASRELDDDGYVLNAVYHSHPQSPARPSATDTENAHWPVACLILSLAGESPVLNGYLIEERIVRELEMLITSEKGAPASVTPDDDHRRQASCAAGGKEVAK
jgi:proteasome lid subunit RPN8/RPN11